MKEQDTSETLPTNENSGNIRVHLKEMLESRGKYPTALSDVDDSQEDIVPSDVNIFKPQTSTSNHPGRKTTSEPENMVQPMDPTGSCSTRGVTLLNEYLVEVFVTSDRDTDLEHVCAVSSKLLLNVNQDEHVNADTTFYWCNFCCFKSDEKGAFLKHVLEHRFYCRFCTHHCFSRAAIARHYVEWHKETSSKLKYCSYLLDILYTQGPNKRKASTTPSDETVPRKRVCHVISDDIEMQPLEDPAVSLTRPNLQKAASHSSSTLTSGHSSLGSSEHNYSSHRNSDSPAQLSTPAPLNIASSLCWNCSYCNFVTFSQSSMVSHQKYSHQGRAREYIVAASISDGGLSKFKQTYHKQGDKSGTVSKATVKDKTSKSVKAKGQRKSSSNKTDNSLTDTRGSGAGKKNPKVSFPFQCAHCSYISPLLQGVKLHLFEHHRGLALYVVDIRLSRPMYVFLCMKLSCSFHTKEKSEFLEHSKICTPWLTGRHPAVDSLLIKSLERTQQCVQVGLRFENTSTDDQVKPTASEDTETEMATNITDCEDTKEDVKQ